MPENNTAGAQTPEIAEKLKPLGVASVDELIAKHQSLTENEAKLKKQYEDAQKFIGQQSHEIGELRKAVPAPVNPKDGETTKTVVTPSAAAKPSEPTLEEIEQSMTPEQKAVADKLYQALPDVTPDPKSGLSKTLLASDPEVRRTFLKVAKESIPSVPKSLWDKPAAAASSAPAVDEDRIRALFATSKRAGSFIPPGPQGAAATTFVPSEGEKPQPIRVGSGGVLEAAKRRRQVAGAA